MLLNRCSILHTGNHLAGVNRDFCCNLRQSISRFSHVSAQPSYIYHQKVNTQVALQVPEGLRILGN